MKDLEYWLHVALHRGGLVGPLILDIFDVSITAKVAVEAGMREEAWERRNEQRLKWEPRCRRARITLAPRSEMDWLLSAGLRCGRARLGAAAAAQGFVGCNVSAAHHKMGNGLKSVLPSLRCLFLCPLLAHPAWPPWFYWVLLGDNVTPFALSGFGVHRIDFHDKIVLGRAERHALLMGFKRTCVAFDLTSSTTHLLVHLAQIHKSPPSRSVTGGADAFAV